MTAAVLVYLAAMNLVLLVTMGIDKLDAIEGRRRVSEATLFSLAVLGGSLGGIAGMLLFRHKTRKTAFVVGFPLILLCQIALAYVVLK